LLSPARAEDAVQQAFLSAHRAIHAGDADLNLRPWLYRIAHNASLNLLRQHGFDHDQVSEDIDGVETPPQAFERHERLRTVVAAVQELPERQRSAIVLQAVEGRSYDEIAAELGVSDGAVRQLLNRARNTLREAAAAITPTGLLTRLPGSGGDGPVADRIAQVVAGSGGGALALKAGTALVVAGALTGGAVTGTLPGAGHPHSARASAASASGGGSAGQQGPGAGAGASAPGALSRSVALGTGRRSRAGSAHGVQVRHVGGGSGRGHGSGGGSSTRDGRGSSGGSSGSGDHAGSRDHSGSGDGSGSGGSSGSGDRSGSGDTGHSGADSGSGGGSTTSTSDGGSHSGSSGSGSGDTTATLVAPPAIPDGSGSGSSGSSISGSGPGDSKSGSSSSDDGSSDPASSTATTGH
jgi:RNA polymerase sigma factor (sigma-70 family)